ncbi:MAG: hypothetical protein ACLQID_24455 [Streptosporangiaceae bacterium]|jgi:hypothetical protein
MTSQCRSRRRPLAGPAARRLAVAGALLLGCGTLAWAVPGGTAQAAVTAGAVRTGGAGKGAVRAEAGTLKDAVTFIGDSVTAGFGYCGVVENASGVSCTVNQPMANSWYLGDNSLFSCAPPSTPDGLNDACSNNNNDGKPWNSPPWSSGPGAPLVAYPYQIAASQSPAGAASVTDWAVSGSTPANWDPAGGEYGPELKKLTDQYVVMTLGGNPLLAAFIRIAFAGFPAVKGACVDSTGYSVGILFPTWYSGPLSAPLGCLTRTWDQIRQTGHLVDIYKALLSQGDRVLVLGYYRSCPWSFGNWQSGSLTGGPASGASCQDQSRPISPEDPTTVTQWQQAGVVGAELNTLISNAVSEAQAWAKERWPNTTRYLDLRWTEPDPVQWALHQPLSTGGSWIQLNDTWIHPDQSGAAQLAGTVTAAMCADFQHWCGTPPAWG